MPIAIQILGELVPVGGKALHIGISMWGVIEETAFPSEVHMISCEEVERGQEKMVIGF